MKAKVKAKAKAKTKTKAKRLETPLKEVLASPKMLHKAAARALSAGFPRERINRLLNGELLTMVEWAHIAQYEDALVHGLFEKPKDVVGSDSFGLSGSSGSRGSSSSSSPSSNPKDAVSGDKVPMFSIIPPSSLIYQALAMRYGAYLAKRKDGGRGYGPFNWRDQPVIGGIYSDAAVRHILAYIDGEEFEHIYDQDTGELIAKVPHLGAALASLGILVDATEHGNLIDNRPKVKQNVAQRLLGEFNKPQKEIRR